MEDGYNYEYDNGGEDGYGYAGLFAKAQQGGAAAQYALGNHFALKREYESAAEWLERSARQGYAAAQYALGNLYASGLGVARDTARAAGLLAQAAESGHSAARYALGKLCAC